MNGISGEAPRKAGDAGFCSHHVEDRDSRSLAFILRWIMPRFFYVADWDVGRLYGFARRCGGISRRSRSET